MPCVAREVVALDDEVAKVQADRDKGQRGVSKRWAASMPVAAFPSRLLDRSRGAAGRFWRSEHRQHRRSLVAPAAHEKSAGASLARTNVDGVVTHDAV